MGGVQNYHPPHQVFRLNIRLLTFLFGRWQDQRTAWCMAVYTVHGIHQYQWTALEPTKRCITNTQIHVNIQIQNCL